MFAQRVLFSFMAAAPLILMPGGGQAHAADKPPVIAALEEQGVIFAQEFEAGKGVRAFAGIVDDSPVAVYVLADGNAVAGTRLNAKGEPMDIETLQNLVAKPISDQSWAQLESTKWVLDGKADAPRVIYTFTDANCPYCHLFWEAPAGQTCARHGLNRPRPTVKPCASSTRWK